MNLKKHGVSFYEASTVFSDPLACIDDDPDHSDSETRMLLIGASERLRILVVVYAERGEKIRIISARRATHFERNQYEEKARK
jgi:uncharacterized DUF497 family protein